MSDSSAEPIERKLRLKQLVDKALEVENQLNQRSALDTLHDIDEMISTSDTINSETTFQELACHSTEVVMDAQLLKMNYELVGKLQQQKIEFNDRLYQDAIIALISRSNGEQWERMTEIACSLAQTTRVKSSMLGAIEVELPKRAVRQTQQRHRATQAAEKQPDAVDKLTRSDKGAEKVNILNKQLQQIFRENDRKPIPFYKLIIDPKNFKVTVENTFQLAFLARDGVIAIEKGPDGHPQVRLASSEERREEKENCQAVCTLNMKLCAEMTAFYNIKQPMLKAQPNTKPENQMEVDEQN